MAKSIQRLRRPPVPLGKDERQAPSQTLRRSRLARIFGLWSDSLGKWRLKEGQRPPSFQMFLVQLDPLPPHPREAVLSLSTDAKSS